MAITPQSRYSQYGASVSRVPDSNGNYQLTVTRLLPISFSSFTLYVWRETDRPDLIASRFLGNPSLWWAIFDINPEIIYPLSVPAGTVVRIPLGPVAGQGTLLQ